MFSAVKLKAVSALLYGVSRCCTEGGGEGGCDDEKGDMEDQRTEQTCASCVAWRLARCRPCVTARGRKLCCSRRSIWDRDFGKMITLMV